MEYLQAVHKIETAKSPADLFGTGDRSEAYHKLAKACHPDMVPANLKDRAKQAFQKLSEWYRITFPEQIVGNWVVTEPLGKGDIADVYHARHKDSGARAAFKVARSSKDNDLLTVERITLKQLQADKQSENFKKYMPILLDEVEMGGCQANVLALVEDKISLADIAAMTGGIDFRHIAWMMNRTLNALGFSHRCGIVHGAVLPSHLMYGPKSHGLCVLDWSYSVSLGKPLEAIVSAAKSNYPQEALRKRPVSAGIDIFMVAKALQSAAKMIPRRFGAWFEYALLASPAARPQDAWELQERWMKLAKEEYGEPKYIELVLPKN